MGILSKLKQKIQNQIKPSQNIFQYKSTFGYIDGRSERIIIKASQSWVFNFIPKKEFGQLFGGNAQWQPPDEYHKDMPDTAIGVWGRREVSRFRRILRERGAVFTVILNEGPKQRLKSISYERILKKSK